MDSDLPKGRFIKLPGGEPEYIVPTYQEDRNLLDLQVATLAVTAPYRDAIYLKARTLESLGRFKEIQDPIVDTSVWTYEQISSLRWKLAKVRNYLDERKNKNRIVLKSTWSFRSKPHIDSEFAVYFRRTRLGISLDQFDMHIRGWASGGLSLVFKEGEIDSASLRIYSFEHDQGYKTHFPEASRTLERAFAGRVTAPPYDSVQVYLYMNGVDYLTVEEEARRDSLAENSSLGAEKRIYRAERLKRFPWAGNHVHGEYRPFLFDGRKNVFDDLTRIYYDGMLTQEQVYYLLRKDEYGSKPITAFQPPLAILAARTSAKSYSATRTPQPTSPDQGKNNPTHLTVAEYLELWRTILNHIPTQDI